jgi:hypothetical protein
MQEHSVGASEALFQSFCDLGELGHARCENTEWSALKAKHGAAADACNRK